LGILEIQDRVIFIGIVIIVWKKGPDPAVFAQLWDFEPGVNQLNNGVMRHCLGDVR